MEHFSIAVFQAISQFSLTSPVARSPGRVEIETRHSGNFPHERNFPNRPVRMTRSSPPSHFSSLTCTSFARSTRSAFSVVSVTALSNGPKNSLSIWTQSCLPSATESSFDSIPEVKPVSIMFGKCVVKKSDTAIPIGVGLNRVFSRSTYCLRSIVPTIDAYVLGRPIPCSSKYRIRLASV